MAREAITVPGWLLDRPELSAGAKLCVALVLQRGEDTPSLDETAAGLCITSQEAQRYVREIERFRLAWVGDRNG